MARFALSLLGPVQATLNGQVINHFAYDKVRALLVYLAVEAGTAHARDALAGLLWPELPNAAARTNLRQALTTLRQALGDLTTDPPMLLISRDTIQFNAACDHALDVTAFQALVSACATHPHRHADRCTSCARRRTEALTLYRGDFLTQFFLPDGAGFEEWATLTRERLHAQARAALATQAVYDERRGAYEDAQHWARRLVELEPWNEDAHQQVMRTLWLGGQRSAALAHYRRCCALLEAELGTEPAPETIALYERIRDNAPRTTAVQHLQAPPVQAAHLLPAATSPLLGREAELAHLADLLELRDCRLLTLVGPGGVGKTRLALQLAADLAHAFADGAVFVALEAIVDPALVPATIAQVLGVPERSGQPILDSLGLALHDRDLLLVLDNFEHLLGAAPLVAALLTQAPQVTVLVTSREVVRLRGEHIVEVSPLPVPPLEGLPAVDRLGDYPAIALFVQRTQALDPAFTLSPNNASSVVQICARLDGLPLAIELAAARSKLFAPAALLTRLEHRLPLLTGGPRDVPARQQTLRNTIDWSYRLLTAGEQLLVRRLAVFVGGWSLAAADAVCRAADGPPLSVLDGLTALVDQSLLHAATDRDGEPRFHLLELVREYALERLEQSGEAETLRQQHARYFLAVAEAAQPPPPEWASGGGPERLAAEQDNLRAALAWAVAGGHAEVAVRLAAALTWFWVEVGHVSEGRQWLETALGLEQAVPAAVRARALRGLAWLVNLFEPGLAHAPLRESLALWRKVGNAEETAWALFLLGNSFYASDPVQATRLLEESRALFETQGNARGVAFVLNRLGTMAHDHGNQLLAAERLEASLALARGLGDKGAMAEALHNLVDIALVQGDEAQAIELEQTSLALFRELGNRGREPWGLKNLGYIALQQGDVAQARSYLVESLALSQEQGLHRGLVYGVVGLAGVAAMEQQAARAARLLGAAEAYVERIKFPFRGGNLRCFEAYREGARAELDETDFAAAWAEGRAMPLEQALAYALAEDPMPAEKARLPSTAQQPDLASLVDVTASAAGRARLTKREREVLRLVAQGLRTTEVAAELGLSPLTVTVHLRAIYRKLGVRSRTAATRLAIEQRLV